MTATAASSVREDERESPDFGHRSQGYDPRMSWPYPKCVGIRSDGERCQGRAGPDGLYCHHHDPARKSSQPASIEIAVAPTINCPTAPGLPEKLSSGPALERTPAETTIDAFTEAFRRTGAARRSRGID